MQPCRKMLVIGSRSQLGQALQAKDREVLALDSNELDITRRADVLKVVARLRPSCIVNAAAYTLVDDAEREVELAYRVNKDGAGYVAEAADEVGARLIHISTDYVFNGLKSSPYLPSDEPDPLNVYGQSKAAGEAVVNDLLGGRCVILRTSALYGIAGRNFVKTMLRVMTERNVVSVVSDQVTCPTWADTLADVVWRIVERPGISGIQHFTDAGVASWYDLAVAIAEEGYDAGLFVALPRVIPIRSVASLHRACRPKYSVLDKTTTWQQLGIEPVHWRTILRRMLQPLGETRLAFEHALPKRDAP